MSKPVSSKRLGKIKPKKLRKRVYRIIALYYEQLPLSLEGSLIYGGRYNKPYQFGALYCGINEEVCWAEIENRMEGPVKRSRFRVYQLQIHLQKVLDLTDPQICAELKIDTESLIHQNEYMFTRQISKEAREEGYEAIIAPSATGSGIILVIFSDRLDPRSKVEIVNP